MNNPAKDKGRRALQAREAAFRMLRERYPNEWKRIHADERIAVGLPPEPGPDGEIRFWRERAEALEAQVRALGGTPDHPFE